MLHCYRSAYLNVTGSGLQQFGEDEDEKEDKIYCLNYIMKHTNFRQQYVDFTVYINMDNGAFHEYLHELGCVHLYIQRIKK